MSKVLFTHSYFLRFDPKQWRIQQPYAPLGTIQAAAVLREAGHGVALFDSMFAHGPEEVIPFLEEHSPDVLVIYDDGFNYLTKMCLTNMREAAFEMSKLAKKQGCKVIVCSSDSTDHYEKYLQEGADFIILGEGEQTLLELITKITAQETDFAAVKGVTYYQEQTLERTPGREVIRDLDSLPMPAWDLVNVLEYKKRWIDNHGYFSINMSTTRGCPFKCNWCAKPIYGNRYNSRSPEKVVEEMDYLNKNYGFHHIWFCDDIFGLKPGWVNQFADLVNEANLRFTFKIQSRVDLLLQENNIAALARAGCDTVWVGAESGSQKILDAMDKGTKLEQIYEATRLLKKHHIKPAFFLQFGYLGETKEDIEATFKMLEDLLPHDIGISVSYPLPGTKFYDKVKEDLQDKTNWTDSDELALMFRNNYSPEYYKRLHRFTHKFFRKKQGQAMAKTLLKNPAAISKSNLRRALATLYYLPTAYLEKKKLEQLEHA